MHMALETYRQKRNFRITPEPKGRGPRRKTRDFAFVIQKHAASHLHYDFRLELNGVLLSWAVPKGPSLDPNDKRLAMQVEDHPMEYGGFEGIIPAKQYGAGTVLLWDRGVWLPKEDPVAGYAKGKLKFDLKGEKLHGGWTLVRSRGSKYGADKAWLLIKEDDEFARRAPDALIVNDQPRSVATGRSIEEIAAERDQVWHSDRSAGENAKAGKARKREVDPSKLDGAIQRPMPDFIEPQLATLVKEAPDGDGWIGEIKLDGYRMLCRIAAGAARLYTRNRKDWTARFESVARASARLPVADAWLDGEIVALDEHGRSSFQTLQNALSLRDESGLYYFVFDVPYLNGFDLRRTPLMDRKRVLESVMASPPGPLRLSYYRQGDSGVFFREACKLRLEGMIAKLAQSPYSGGRNRAWVKVKCGMRQEMVIGGFTDPEGSRQGLGALLLGVYQPDGKLRYSGKVGTGFDDETLRDLRRQLDALVQTRPAFGNPPRGAEARRAHWVKPELVAEVAFTEWTEDGTLRHPSFQGLRTDKKAAEVVREHPAAAESDSGPARSAPRQESVRTRASARRASQDDADFAGIHLSNAQKLLYPEAGISKRDLAAYYESIGEWMIPHVRQRPLTLLRCPNGWDKPCFYQKNAGRGIDEAIERVKVQTSDGPAVYMMADSVRALVALVQMGVLEIHPWGATANRLGFPDRIVFDLDPDDDLPWETLAQGVRLVRKLLDDIGLRAFLKTTGGKGLHVMVPIKPTRPWPVIKGFSKTIAELCAVTFPDRFTAKIAKAARRGKIFIDYLRNDEGSTAVAAYSIRARANAPVSTPVSWDEISKEVRFDHFSVKTVPARLKRLKADPWDDFFETRQALGSGMMNKVGFRQ
jgi:bifunctional non-homologous end joining protein LigD